MKRMILKGGRVVDPRNRIDDQLDVIIEDGKIVSLVESARVEEGTKVYDATGLIIMPGLVDMHTHLREPGQEYKETIYTGTRAAAMGGFTAMACMPNTSPVNDHPAITQAINDICTRDAAISVYPIGSITRDLKGTHLTEMGLMQEAGCVAFSDDGKPVASAKMMMHAMQYAKNFDTLLISHCEEPSLGAGDMNEGTLNTIMGLHGIDRSAEEIMVARDILLAESQQARVHIAHISTKGSVELVRQAKRRGVMVTCETCPHYIAGTEDLVRGYNTDAKVNPPLREEEDRLAIIEGLRDRTIDAIATDHAPHHMDEKHVEFALAANGISGIETALSLCYTHLVDSGIMSMAELVTLMSTTPAGILGIEGGSLEEGKMANITIVDPNETYTIDTATFQSKGKNNPFHGQQVKGKVKGTICQGEIVVWDGKLQK